MAAGGVPADPVICGNYLNGSLFMSFFMYSMLGLDAAYPELKLQNYLNDAGKAAFAAVGNSCAIDGLLLYPFHTFSEYVTSDPTQTPAWGARIMQTKLGTRPQPVPYYQYHGQIDEVVPYRSGCSPARDLLQHGCENGIYNDGPHRSHFRRFYRGAGRHQFPGRSAGWPDRTPKLPLTWFSRKQSANVSFRQTCLAISILDDLNK